MYPGLYHLDLALATIQTSYLALGKAAAHKNCHCSWSNQHMLQAANQYIQPESGKVLLMDSKNSLALAELKVEFVFVGYLLLAGSIQSIDLLVEMLAEHMSWVGHLLAKQLERLLVAVAAKAERPVPWTTMIGWALHQQLQLEDSELMQLEQIQEPEKVTLANLMAVQQLQV
jgi:hypothetical protein